MRWVVIVLVAFSLAIASLAFLGGQQRPMCACPVAPGLVVEDLPATDTSTDDTLSESRLVSRSR